MKPIRIALTKGRLEQETVALLEKMGLDTAAVRAAKSRRSTACGTTPNSSANFCRLEASRATAWTVQPFSTNRRVMASPIFGGALDADAA